MQEVTSSLIINILPKMSNPESDQFSFYKNCKSLTTNSSMIMTETKEKEDFDFFNFYPDRNFDDINEIFSFSMDPMHESELNMHFQHNQQDSNRNAINVYDEAVLELPTQPKLFDSNDISHEYPIFESEKVS